MIGRWLFAIFLGLFCKVLLAQGMPDFPFIIVSGVASIDVQPDTANISFTLTSYKESSEEALVKLEETQKAILDLTDRYGISREKILAQAVSKSITRRENENGQYEEIIGYQFWQTFGLSLDSLEKYPEFINELMAIDNLGNVEQRFDSSNKTQIITDLVKAAGVDAIRKAENVAEGLGVRVKSVYAINEGGSGFGSFSAKFGVPNNNRQISYAPGGYQETMALLVPKTINFSRSVDVVYKISP